MGGEGVAHHRGRGLLECLLPAMLCVDVGSVFTLRVAYYGQSFLTLVVKSVASAHPI